MVRKISWSDNSKEDLFSILEYWLKRNGNNVYPRKIFKRISKTTNLLKYYPEIGMVYNELNVRFLVKDTFQIFYDFTDTEVHILHVWDTRRDKSNLKL